jgi:hypothetical protein
MARGDCRGAWHETVERVFLSTPSHIPFQYPSINSSERYFKGNLCRAECIVKVIYDNIYLKWYFEGSSFSKLRETDCGREWFMYHSWELRMKDCCNKVSQILIHEFSFFPEFVDFPPYFLESDTRYSIRNNLVVVDCRIQYYLSLDLNPYIQYNFYPPVKGHRPVRKGRAYER